jgi:hypothetical protein
LRRCHKNKWFIRQMRLFFLGGYRAPSPAVQAQRRCNDFRTGRRGVAESGSRDRSSRQRRRQQPGCCAAAGLLAEGCWCQSTPFPAHTVKLPAQGSLARERGFSVWFKNQGTVVTSRAMRNPTTVGPLACAPNPASGMRHDLAVSS